MTFVRSQLRILFARCLEVVLQDTLAIVPLQTVTAASFTSRRVVGIVYFSSNSVLDLEKPALLIAMVAHVFASDPEAAALGAELEPEFARFPVVQRFHVATCEVALRDFALELKTQQVLLYVSVHVLEHDRARSLARLRTGLAARRPLREAVGAAERLASVAFLGLIHHFGADGADEEVTSLAFGFIVLYQIRDVEVGVVDGVDGLRLIGETIWVLSAQLLHRFLYLRAANNLRI